MNQHHFPEKAPELIDLIGGQAWSGSWDEKPIRIPGSRAAETEAPTAEPAALELRQPELEPHQPERAPADDMSLAA